MAVVPSEDGTHECYTGTNCRTSRRRIRSTQARKNDHHILHARVAQQANERGNVGDHGARLEASRRASSDRMKDISFSIRSWGVRRRCSRRSVRSTSRLYSSITGSGGRASGRSALMGRVYIRVVHDVLSHRVAPRGVQALVRACAALPVRTDEARARAGLFNFLAKLVPGERIELSRPLRVPGF